MSHISILVPSSPACVGLQQSFNCLSLTFSLSLKKTTKYFSYALDKNREEIT